ncbi:MAG: GIY-YIG nuclease family protein [Patescibacteria group bacterium]
MNLKNFFTYILESTINSSYYIGSCQDVHVRLKQHNCGMVEVNKTLFAVDTGLL